MMMKRETMSATSKERRVLGGKNLLNALQNKNLQSLCQKNVCSPLKRKGGRDRVKHEIQKPRNDDRVFREENTRTLRGRRNKTQTSYSKKNYQWCNKKRKRFEEVANHIL